MPSVRRYHERDWDAFVELDVEVGLQTLRHAPEEEREIFRKRWPTRLKERWSWGPEGPVAEASALFVVEDDDGAYGGHLWLTESEDVRTGVARLWVNSVAVVQRCRSRGFGRLLMERAEEEARARGITSIGLRVDADNVVARKLYEEMGYQTVRLRMIKQLRRG
ncbi:MAG: GNAT family N-acetyltransferase [Polyangiales bacterium]